MRLRPIAGDAPAETFWTLSDVKAHLIVQHAGDDDYITSLCAAAAEHLTGPETIWRRCWVSQEWTEKASCFDELRLTIGPVQAVSSVQYLDSDDVLQTVPENDYYLLDELNHSSLVPMPGKHWPGDVSERLDAVRATYVAGYGAGADDAPKPVVQAHKQLVGHWYNLREAVIVGAGVREVPMTVQYLMKPFERISGHGF